MYPIGYIARFMPDSLPGRAESFEFMRLLNLGSAKRQMKTPSLSCLIDIIEKVFSSLDGVEPGFNLSGVGKKEPYYPMV